jgi:hypothetical protein
VYYSISDGNVTDANISIVIIDDKTLADTTVSNINSNIINSKPFQSNFGSFAVRKALTLTELTILPQQQAPPPPTPEPSPATTPKSTEGNSNIGAIVGGVAGGVVGLVLIGIVVWVLTGNDTSKPTTATPLPRTGSRFIYRQARHGNNSNIGIAVSQRGNPQKPKQPIPTRKIYI